MSVGDEFYTYNFQVESDESHFNLVCTSSVQLFLSRLTNDDLYHWWFGLTDFVKRERFSRELKTKSKSRIKDLFV